MRYYPNFLVGKTKAAKSVDIEIDYKNVEINKIMNKLHKLYDHDVREINSQEFNGVVLQYAKADQNNVIFFMHKDEHANLAFKALSNHPVFYSCVFFSIQNPSKELF